MWAHDGIRHPGRPANDDHWLLWPIKTIATLGGLPLRLLGLIAAGLARVWERYFEPPPAWLTRYLIVIPVTWLWRHPVAIPGAP
ncbi:hypothetical protein [Actinoplanes rectilineatus]|uniref:hypothetical protein n=1 Tax=Actinoplanes rectilineatus TaxID=113571 RepID=UPI0005F2C316|nr:hypothetical protein [Actinoplanes rectilineatus]